MVAIGRIAVDLDYNKNNTRQLKRNRYDIRSSELSTLNNRYNKVLEGHQFGDRELDSNFAQFLRYFSQSLTDEAPRDEDNEDEAEADKDPEYSMFLKELRGNGKSYKLNMSVGGEVPLFLEYEQLDECEPTTHIDINVGDNRRNISSSEDMSNSQNNQQEEYWTNLRPQERMKNGSSKQTKRLERTSKLDYQQNTAVDECYKKLLDGAIKSTDSSFIYEGKRIDYGFSVTRSDSEVVVLNDLQNCIGGNDNQLVTAERDPSADLKKELMRILRQPYDRKEYERLFEYVNEKRPVCHHKDLRDRAVSFPIDGLTKSLLDDFHGFDKRLGAAEAEHDGPKALNLLRGFCFWLEHLPNEGMFRPWLDKECRKARPKRKRPVDEQN